MKKALAAAVVVLAAMAAAAALPGHAEGAEDDPRTLRVGLNGWENNVTPFSITFASQPTTVDFLNLVYDTLFWSQTRPDPEPWLAEEANPSPDRKIWTVKLRRGVKWHDGRPFTAEDVKFSFEYFKRHAGRSGRYGHHVAEVPVFERAQVLNPEEIRLFFADPVPGFRTLPGADLPMLPRHVWQKVDDPLQATEQKPVGTGPFTVAAMVDRRSYKLTANPDYFKGKPLIDVMDVVVEGDPNVSFNDLVAGKLDFVSNTVPPIFVDQLTANPEIKVVRASRMESVQLNFNARKQPLSDPKLRKAISLAIDNGVLVKSVAGGRGRPGVDGFVHPESSWAAPNGRHEYDVGKANQILDAAGYSRKDSDGIRRGPDGKRLSFSALFSTLEPQSLEALQLISQMTTAIGVRIEPEPATPSELRAVRRPGPKVIPPYDAYVSELEAHTHSDPDGLLFFFHSPGKGMGSQITGYSNPAFDRLVEDAATTVSLPERKRKLAEAQAILAEEIPSLALFYPDGVYAFRPAAYDGWVPDPGHGIFTKRSFLEAYAKAEEAAGRQNPISPAWIFLGGVAALVLAGSGIVLLRRRRASPEEFLDDDEEEPGESGEVAAHLPAPEPLPEPQAAPQAATAEPEGKPSLQPPNGLWEQPPSGEPPRWPSFMGPLPQGPPPSDATNGLDLPPWAPPEERLRAPGGVAPDFERPKFPEVAADDEAPAPEFPPPLHLPEKPKDAPGEPSIETRPGGSEAD